MPSPSIPCPALLQRLFGEEEVITLEDLLLKLSGLSRNASQLRDTLVQPHDHPDYARRLLANTFCVVSPDAPVLRDGFSLQQFSNQAELVARAVEAMLQSARTKNNMLALGHRKRRESSMGRQLVGMSTAEAYHPNSLTAQLAGPSWQLLLSRIGDTLMLYLLIHTSIFARLPNSCCLQLCGPPLPQAVRQWRAAQGGGSSSNNTRDHAGRGLPAPATRHAGILGAAAVRDGCGQRLMQQARQGQQPGQGASGGGQQGRVSRPSSWQRRKAAALRAAGERAKQQQQQRVAGLTTGHAPQADPPMADSSLPPTQVVEAPENGAPSEGQAGPQESAGVTVLVQPEGEGRLPGPAAQRQQSDGCCAPAGAVAWPTAAAGMGGDHAAVGDGSEQQARVPPGVHANGLELHRQQVRRQAEQQQRSQSRSQRRADLWPAGVPKPTDMVIQRSGLFYCATFPPRPGFPAQHILRALQGQKAAARRLYAAIFDPRHNPVGRAGHAHVATHRLVPPAPRRVPRRHRPLLLLLQKVLDRCPRVPYCLLLNKHCPLPHQLRAPASCPPPPQRPSQQSQPSGDQLAQQQQQQQQQRGRQLEQHSQQVPQPQRQQLAQLVCTAQVPQPSAAAAATLAPGARGKPVPAQGGMPPPAAAPPTGTVAECPAADLDTLMDELYQLDSLPAAKAGSGEPEDACLLAAPGPRSSSQGGWAAQAAGTVPGPGAGLEASYGGSGMPAAVHCPEGRLPACPAVPAADHATAAAVVAARAPLADLDSLMDDLYHSEQQGKHHRQQLSGLTGVLECCLPNGAIRALPELLGSPGDSARRKRPRQTTSPGAAGAACTTLRGPVHVVASIAAAAHAGGAPPAGILLGSAELAAPSADVAPPTQPATQLLTVVPDSEEQQWASLPATQPVEGEPGTVDVMANVDAGVGKQAGSSQQAQQRQQQPLQAPPPAGPASLASEFVPHQQVAAFVWGVVRRLLPAALLGSRHNRGRLRAAIRRFVGLRRYEQMSVHQALQGMRLGQCAWLRATAQPQRAQHGAAQEQPQGGQQQARQGQQLQARTYVGGAQAAAVQVHVTPEAPADRARGQRQHGACRRANPAAKQPDRPPFAAPRRAAAACPSDHSAQQRWLALWLGWLLSVVVVPLLRAHFYCTESEAYRQEVFYYRKPVWARLAHAAVRELEGSQFEAVPRQQAQAVLQSRKLGVAKLRLLPKRTGMRFIVNLGRATTVAFPGAKAGPAGQRPGPGVGTGWGVVGAKRAQRQPPVKLTFKPVNSFLQNVYQVLKFEAAAQPGALGASIFGLNDAYCRLQPFIRRWRAAAAACGTTPASGTAPTSPLPKSAAPGAGAGTGSHRPLQALHPAQAGNTPGAAPAQVGCPSRQRQFGTGEAGTDTAATAAAHQQPACGLRPYLVSVDVTRAFDHVDIGLLLGLVEPLLRHQEYLIVKYTEVVPSLGGVKLLYRRAATAAGACAGAAHDFPALAHRLAQGFRGKAFVDQVVYDRVTRPALLCLLRQHLTANLVKLRRDWHRQCRGLAQGSTLSTLLCSLYLAHVERTHLQPLIAQAFAGAAAAGGAAPAGVCSGSGGGGGVGGGGASRVLGVTGGCRGSGQEAGQPAGRSAAAAGSGAAAAAAVAAGLAGGAACSLGTSSRGLLTALAGAAAEDSCCPIVVGSEARYPGHLAAEVLGASAGSPPGGTAAAAAAGGAAGGGGPPSQGGGGRLVPQPGQAGAGGAAPYSATLLLRLVDDFLLLTSLPAVAAAVAGRMLEGFPDCNVHVNPHKTKLSFELSVGSSTRPPRLLPAALHRAASGAAFIKWCGLLVNVANLEVQGDYTRYVGEHISSSLTLPLRKRPGEALATKLCHYLRPKVHPLLLDGAINSQQTIWLNIFQAFLLGAMKFHCYVSALPSAPAPSTGVLQAAVERGIAFMYTLTRRRRVRPAAAPPGTRPVNCLAQVSRAHVRWLGLTAFAKVLRRKPTRYAALLCTLQEQLQAPATRQLARALAPVVEDVHSDVFLHIRY
ncbi:hypothetical protein N2152v2_001915 [Parachlorella kessleri]